MNCESTNRTSSTLRQLCRFLATNLANLCQDIISVTTHQMTCGSSRGPTYATLSSTPGTLRARLQMTEARTERLRPTLHGKTIGSTKKTSRKEKKLVKDNESGDSMVFLLVSWSSRPRQNWSLLPFHEAQAWTSAAALHALYHSSDETGPFTLSKKGFWGIWQAYFGSLWHAYIDDSVAKRFKNSNGFLETGRGRHFSKRPGPQCAWETCDGAISRYHLQRHAAWRGNNSFSNHSQDSSGKYFVELCFLVLWKMLTKIYSLRGFVTHKGLFITLVVSCQILVFIYCVLRWLVLPVCGCWYARCSA